MAIAENDIVDGVNAGNDIEMPGGNYSDADRIVEAVENGKISEKWFSQKYWM